MNKIPKTIHYCWLGGKPLPEMAIRCIESWRKFCPEYEIIEWNESNYDFTKHPYMNAAYSSKSWGFVPDYARLDIIYRYGGIYLDTDVEIIKPLDPLLENQAFMGFEKSSQNGGFVNCGHGFGAVPGNPIIKHLRDIYDNVSFCNEDGTINLVASPYYTTLGLVENGLIKKDSKQELLSLTVFPSDYFCPIDYDTGKLQITNNTYSIHHFMASWLSTADKTVKKIERVFCQKGRFSYIVGRMLSFPFRVWGKLEKIGFKEFIKLVGAKVMGKA